MPLMKKDNRYVVFFIEFVTLYIQNMNKNLKNMGHTGQKREEKWGAGTIENMTEFSRAGFGPGNARTTPVHFIEFKVPYNNIVQLFSTLPVLYIWHENFRKNYPALAYPKKS